MYEIQCKTKTNSVNSREVLSAHSMNKEKQKAYLISRKCAEPLKVPSSPQETSQISLGAHWPLKNDCIQKILDEQRAEKDAPSAAHDGASARKRKQA